MICRPVNGRIGGIHHIPKRSVVAQIFRDDKTPALGRVMNAHHVSDLVFTALSIRQSRSPYVRGHFPLDQNTESSCQEETLPF